MCPFLFNLQDIALPEREISSGGLEVESQEVSTGRVQNEAGKFHLAGVWIGP